MSLKIEFQPGVIVHNCNPNYLGARGWRDHEFKANLCKVRRTLSQIQNTNKRAKGMA
jgi:hypothetical protein